MKRGSFLDQDILYTSLSYLNIIFRKWYVLANARLEPDNFRHLYSYYVTSTKSIYIQKCLRKMGEKEASQKQTSIFFADVTVEWRV